MTQVLVNLLEIHDPDEGPRVVNVERSILGKGLRVRMDDGSLFAVEVVRL